MRVVIEGERGGRLLLGRPWVDVICRRDAGQICGAGWLPQCEQLTAHKTAFDFNVDAQHDLQKCKCLDEFNQIELFGLPVGLDVLMVSVVLVSSNMAMRWFRRRNLRSNRVWVMSA
jgi:hypothetical protein